MRQCASDNQGIYCTLGTPHGALFFGFKSEILFAFEGKGREKKSLFLSKKTKKPCFGFARRLLVITWHPPSLAEKELLPTRGECGKKCEIYDALSLNNKIVEEKKSRHSACMC